MTNIFIDESGSITNKYPDQKYFVITLLVVKDMKKLAHTYKRFVTSHFKELKKSDFNNKMFANGKFKELKGCCLTRELKKEFVTYFAKNNYFEIYWIEIDNKKLSDKFCANTARSFNYVLCLAIDYFLHHNLMEQDAYFLHLDERNERTKAKFFLEDYLNTQISLATDFNNDFSVKYYDSENNPFIQIADVFANLYFSHLATEAYSDEIEVLTKNGYVKKIFKFPLS